MGQVNRRGPDGAMGEPQRALRRLRGSRIMPALAAVTLICTFGLAGIMYVAARANATSAAETRTLQDAQVVRQLLADAGPSLTLQGGQLVVGTDSSVYILNGETTLVDRAHSLTGNYTSIYQMEGAGLVTIASSLPSGAGGARPLGDALTGAPFAALVGNCGAMDTQTCHQAYSGVLRLRGVDYIVGMQPLFDGSGAFVGALGTAQPLGGVLAPVNQLAVVLLLVGLLLSFVCIVGGNWLVGSRSEQVLAALDARLDDVAEAAAQLERLAQAQVARGNTQGRAARQASEQARTLDALASAMEQGQAALRESAGSIWQEMSQPGAAPDSQTALQWARQAALMSARVGTAAERARTVCRQLIMLLNHVVAEGSVATDQGRAMQVRAHELRESVEGVEAVLGERLITRPHGIAALPLVRHARRLLSSRSLARSARGAKSAAGEAATSHSRSGQTDRQHAGGRSASPERPRQGTGPLVSESLWLGDNRQQTGQQPAIGHERVTGQQPRVRPPSDLGRSGGTGQYPHLQPGQTGAQPAFQPGTAQQPGIPNPPSGWTGAHRALPPLHPPARPDANGNNSSGYGQHGPVSQFGHHGPVSQFGQTGQHHALQWRPPSAPRTPQSATPGDPRAQPWSAPGFGLPELDPHAPRRDGQEGPTDHGSRWPEEQE
jgi:Cache 3/Cache 2 fusion domain